MERGKSMFRSIIMITCDVCGTTDEENEGLTKKQFKVHLRKNGWTLGKIHRCPGCKGLLTEEGATAPKT